MAQLKLSSNDFERIPATIKQLLELIKIDLSGCGRLRCLPELPSRLLALMASDCVSLESVARLFIQGEEDDEAASREFNLDNCLESDQTPALELWVMPS